jgi:hypothetical protein
MCVRACVRVCVCVCVYARARAYIYVHRCTCMRRRREIKVLLKLHTNKQPLEADYVIKANGINYMCDTQYTSLVKHAHNELCDDAAGAERV